MLDNKTKLELNKLFLELMEGSISDSRLLMLDEYLRKSPEAQAYYCQFMHTQVSMNKVFGSMTSADSFAVFSENDSNKDVLTDFDEAANSGSKVGSDSNVSLRGVGLEDFTLDVNRDDADDGEMTQAMLELLEMERTSPAVIIDKEEPKRELIQKVESDFKWFPGEGNKPLLVAMLTVAACFLVFIGYLHFFVPDPVPSVDVATVTDQMHVLWGDSSLIYSNGERLWTNDFPLDLKRGIISIKYDDGVEVLIEGPALFEIERSGIYLQYGRLYGKVSQAGLGFTVRTPTSQFVDQGTEFGVLAEVNGSAELHVTKGKVQLFAGLNGESRTSQVITENKAVRFNAKSGRVNDVAVEKQGFVRHIDSNTGFVWSGQRMQIALDLADVIGGGNGLGTGKQKAWLDVQTGKFTDFANPDKTAASKNYVKVAASDYIDGVFSPDGGSGQVQVSSGGHIFSKCPDTDGAYQYNISNGHEISIIGIGNNNRLPKPPVLGGKRYGTKDDPVIILTANKGITFDLAVLRKVMPDSEVQRFTAICGLSETNISNGICKVYQGAATFWVLVDGKVRFNTEKVHLAGEAPDTPANINIPINSNDRFLTLIATDGYTYDDEGFLANILADYSIFARPTLHLSREIQP